MKSDTTSKDTIVISWGIEYPVMKEANFLTGVSYMHWRLTDQGRQDGEKLLR